MKRLGIVLAVILGGCGMAMPSGGDAATDGGACQAVVYGACSPGDDCTALHQGTGCYQGQCVRILDAVAGDRTECMQAGGVVTTVGGAVVCAPPASCHD